MAEERGLEKVLKDSGPGSEQAQAARAIEHCVIATEDLSDAMFEVVVESVKRIRQASKGNLVELEEINEKLHQNESRRRWMRRKG